MPIVFVYGMSVVDKNRLRLRRRIQAAGANLRKLKLTKKQTTVFFVPPEPCFDYDEKNPGDVIVIVKGLFAKPERTNAVRQEYATRLGEIIKDAVAESAWPVGVIEVLLDQPFDPSAGIYQSRG